MKNWNKNFIWVIVIALSFSVFACSKGLKKEGIAEMSEKADSLVKAAPDCGAPSTSGSDINISSLKGSWVVLYFYPKAFTGG